MKIGFDIDDTLINLREYAFHLYNRKLQKKVPREEFLKLDRLEIHEPFGMDDQEGKQMWLDSREEIYYTDCPPFPGAVELLQELAEEGHEIYYITARPAEHGERTKDWMRKKGFPIRDSRFFYGMKDEEKIHTIKELDLDYYVDDKPKVLDTLSDIPARLFLKDQTYNRHIRHVSRITDWSEFREIIDDHLL
ncbi:HAD family acid phosphatase [Virgibacillus xinjiangensis]|uniref:Nucleotidase n=1 Tax=Virgibacillus xinjiangensis TaxID=393090 RepID=A0ABV7CZR7_9BACI